MSDITISYKGNSIATMDATGTKTLLTEGKYCEDDITIDYTQPSGGGYTIDELASGAEPHGNIVINAATIAQYAFYTKSLITGVTAENATNIEVGAFQATSDGYGNIEFVNAHNVEKLGNYWIVRHKVSTLVFPKINQPYPGQNRFSTQRSNITTVDLGGADLRLTNKDFESNSAMTTVILRPSYVVPLLNTACFNGSPFKNGGTGGTIYIPQSLYNHLGDNSSDDYQHASNWATVVGWGTITWAKIEGSNYETHYADGTVIS